MYADVTKKCEIVVTSSFSSKLMSVYKTMKKNNIFIVGFCLDKFFCNLAPSASSMPSATSKVNGRFEHNFKVILCNSFTEMSYKHIMKIYKLFLFSFILPISKTVHFLSNFSSDF